jgi:hypothetical protein
MSDTSQKANKLASALYLVTSFFSDQEPLKWKLRELSTHLLSASLSFKSYLFEERDYAPLENRQTVLEIISLLAVAKNVGLISETNHTLLSQEFSKYLTNIGFPTGLEEKEGRAVLSEKFFASAEKLPPASSVNNEIDVKDKIADEPKREEPKKDDSTVLRAGYLPQVAPESVLKSERSKDQTLKQFGAVSVKKNSRQSIIINLLKRKKEIMIKDVSPLISGCSEKTIQRELSAMVAAGILKKIGEKRWSRYSLVQNA